MLTRENPWKLHCLHLQTVSFSMLDKRGDPRRRNSLSPDRKCVCYFSFFSFHFIAAHNFQKNECSDGKIEFMLECKLCYKLNDDDEENHVTNKSHHRIVRAKELRESQWNWGEWFFTVGTGHTNTNCVANINTLNCAAGKITKWWHRDISAGGNFLIHIGTYFIGSPPREKLFYDFSQSH